MVDVVQLVEHRIVVPSVVGSSPIIHPKEESKVCSLLLVYTGGSGTAAVTFWSVFVTLAGPQVPRR